VEMRRGSVDGWSKPSPARFIPPIGAAPSFAFMTGGAVQSAATAAWLVRLPSFMHHHVALGIKVDIDSLIRFLSGRAIGFVAAGGGSFGTAHVGYLQGVFVSAA